jgi:hypothetical protein
MNGEFKRYIYIIGTICVIFLIGSIVLHILPWLLIAGLVVYVVTKIVRFIKGKTEKKNSNSFHSNHVDKEYIYKDAANDYTNGEVIDVEYEDVDNKKD